jgi:hypothetical protein
MGLKSYTLRLDEEEYEKLKGFLDKYGDPDLNISFILRRYIRDLNAALPNLEKGSLNLLNSLSLYGTALKQMIRTAEVESLVKGRTLRGSTEILERAQSEIDDKKEFRAMKDKRKKK